MLATLLLILASDSLNLDFASGQLTGWTGSGFELRDGRLSSSAAKSGLLHYTFRLPANAAMLRFSAAVHRLELADPKRPMDILLEAPGREYVPRQVWREDKWEKSEALSPIGDKGELAEYIWRVDKHAGKNVRIILIDADPREGSYLVCTGFQLLTRDSVNQTHFENDIRGVCQKHDLPQPERYTSEHFLAYSNAGPGFTRERLKDCERMYAAFFRHFRRKGFLLTPPAEKLMVAIFSTQQGFEAFIGHQPGAHVTGMYHTPTNRLVVYDYGTNTAFLSDKKELEEKARRTSSDLGRPMTSDRLLREHRRDVNVSTLMHEVAHQLSFNTGMLLRGGDAPAWLIEGLAMYCEPTLAGEWQGIGQLNPMRIKVLKERQPFKMRQLVVNDDWLRKTPRVEDVVAGYSQSWALFRFLMEEHPKKLRQYFDLIRNRRTPDHRLADFAEVFGKIAELEKRYEEYVEEILSGDR
ncbi:MAG: DUF1570 domain-containing protein [Gemmataceae bacterium]